MKKRIVLIGFLAAAIVGFAQTPPAPAPPPTPGTTTIEEGDALRMHDAQTTLQNLQLEYQLLQVQLGQLQAEYAKQKNDTEALTAKMRFKYHLSPDALFSPDFKQASAPAPAPVPAKTESKPETAPKPVDKPTKK